MTLEQSRQRLKDFALDAALGAIIALAVTHGHGGSGGGPRPGYIVDRPTGYCIHLTTTSWERVSFRQYCE